MGLARVLVQDPYSSGLPEILSVAHVVQGILRVLELLQLRSPANRAPEDHINTRVLHPGSNYQDKGDSRKHGL